MEDKAARLFVFAGTTEGRDFVAKFCERLNHSGCEKPWRIHIFTATEYGGELVQEKLETLQAALEIHSGRLDAEGIYEALVRHKPSYTIDCTHPHAVEISRNLKTACARGGYSYLRLGRGEMLLPPDLQARQVENLEESAVFLRSRKGNILLTTGSKELSPFTHPDLQNRVFIRVLPLEASIRCCKTLGFQNRNIIAMQGPFSEDMNRVLIREIRAAWLVTKDSGAEGGLREKLAAAAQERIGVVIVRRPREPESIGLEEILNILLKEEKPFLRAPTETAAPEKRIYLIGMGGGGEAGMTGEALTAVRTSQCVIGAPRLTAAAENLIAGKPTFNLIAAEEIIDCIAQSDYSAFAVLFSGDSGFYSGAKKLIPLLQEQGRQFTVLPGVSSLSCFAARLSLSWEDAAVVSLHGRKANILSPVMYHPKTFFLTGGQTGPSALCAVLTAAGLGELTVHIGERLSYPEERITTGTAASLAVQEFDSLSVVIVENPFPLSSALGNYSLPDNGFIRAEVPMTKEEVRAVSLSKLRIKPDSIAWDIGAGTGSVACEMALKAKEGWVYAVEQNPKALSLIEENRKKFGLFNLEAVSGAAPQALEDLPSPDRVFIGGSSGKLEPILETVLAKNPCARVVINGIALETVNSAILLMKKYAFKDIDIVQISVSRAEYRGNVHLMKSLNPVFIISGWGERM